MTVVIFASPRYALRVISRTFPFTRPLCVGSSLTNHAINLTRIKPMCFPSAPFLNNRLRSTANAFANGLGRKVPRVYYKVNSTKYVYLTALSRRLAVAKRINSGHRRLVGRSVGRAFLRADLNYSFCLGPVDTQRVQPLGQRNNRGVF